MSTPPDTGEVHLCRRLRWKGFYGAPWRTPEELAGALRNADSPFSCLHTCEAWGPDDDLAAPERCTPERTCFERSPHQPRRALS